MAASELLRDGRLDEALASLQAEVRADAADVKHRVFLFQLLCVMGQWDRALTQLNVASELDPAAVVMAHAYRECLRCEVLREEVFAGRRTPLVFGEPPEWMGLMIEALRCAGTGAHEAAAGLRERAFEQAPATAGTIDGEAFEWMADADPRLGPILEVIVNGRYYWAPFTSIRRIDIEEPSDLRDVVWMPAHFEWANEGEVVGLIPTRYVGSEKADDDATRLARRTDWIEQDGQTIALGQRMLATDAGEYPLMNIRQVILASGGRQEEVDDG